jgi:predicted  nucleic acid-binding Zn-ribbon protein
MNIILHQIKFDRIRRQIVLYHLLVCLALYLVAGCSSAFLTSDARKDGMIDRHSNAILTNPDWPKPYYYRSILYKEIGEYEKALADAKKYCELAPEDIVCSQLIKEYGFEPPLISYAKEKEDLKRKLHESIEKHDLSTQKKNELVAALYEKERQLNTKNAQLDIAKQKFDEYQRQIETLNRRAQDLNRQLMQVQSKEEVSDTQAELEHILNRKAQLEPEVGHLTVQKQKLHEEVSNLNRLIANARHEFEKAKKELLEVRQRETRLEEQLAQLKKQLQKKLEPVLVISKPKDGSVIKYATTNLHIVAVDDNGISDLKVFINNVPVELNNQRALKLPAKEDALHSPKIDVTLKIQLSYGPNEILVKAIDTDGLEAAEKIQVVRIKERGKIWAAVIGINQYQKTRSLKYAVNDANAFKDYLKTNLQLPSHQIFFLTNQEATKDNLLSVLGTKLRRKAATEDTVIIFFAGHGAVEADPINPDGDGFEKYLLPFDANLNDLYSTAISMGEVTRIFHRIQSDRLIFIADTCYSGAAGGRTQLAAKTRAALSDHFFDRISRGKGRVIISSCSPNEVSKEDDRYKHGLFTYYLLKGLKGEADADADGLINMDELFSYLSKKVPEASGQDQHPVRKGETEGELIVGRVLE